MITPYPEANWIQPVLKPDFVTKVATYRTLPNNTRMQCGVTSVPTPYNSSTLQHQMK